MQNNDFLISNCVTLKQAIAKIEANEYKILYVVDDDKHVIGTLTDGDVRRYLLKSGTINDSITNAINKNFKFLETKNKNQAESFMKEYDITSVPVVNSKMQISYVYYKGMESSVNKINVPVVIQAGGFGTRLYPYTKILPKPLIPIGDIPIVEMIINKFYESGCTDFYLIVNHKKNMIKSYFAEDKRPYNIHFIEESTPLGTGGGLSLLKGMINKTFILTNCDILLETDFSEILEQHNKEKNVITMVCVNKEIQIPYGVIELDKKGKIDTITEKPTFNYISNAGAYIIEPNVIEEMLDNIKIGFPDVFDKYRLDGQSVGVHIVKDEDFMDMGELEELEKMRRKLESK